MPQSSSEFRMEMVLNIIVTSIVMVKVTFPKHGRFPSNSYPFSYVASKVSALPLQSTDLSLVYCLNDENSCIYLGLPVSASFPTFPDDLKLISQHLRDNTPFFNTSSFFQLNKSLVHLASVLGTFGDQFLLSFVDILTMDYNQLLKKHPACLIG